MPYCVASNFTGGMCNYKSNELNYFWYHDPHGRIDKVFYLCMKHSNLIVDGLMEKEIGYSKLIKTCYDQIEKKKHELEKGSNLSEQREATKNAIENGLSRPKFKSVQEMKDEISRLYNVVNNVKKILVIERNKVCRFCKFPLREPELAKDQLGSKYTNVDFKSFNGYRRLDALFHTECGITWLVNKIKLKSDEMRYLQPKRTGQHTLFSGVEW